MNARGFFHAGGLQATVSPTVFFWTLACTLLGLTTGCQSTLPPLSQEDLSLTETNLATVLRAYDTIFCDAVSSYWAQLLKRTPVPQDSGEVILQFSLHPDGQLSGLVMAKNTEGLSYGLLCQKAITDPAPYAPWPPELRKQFGKTRLFEITFQFDLDGHGFLAYIDDPQFKGPAFAKGKATRIVFYLPDKHRIVEASEHPWAGQMPSRKVLETNRDRRNNGSDLYVPAAPYWGGMPYNWFPEQGRGGNLGKLPEVRPPNFGR